MPKHYALLSFDLEDEPAHLPAFKAEMKAHRWQFAYEGLHVPHSTCVGVFPASMSTHDVEKQISAQLDTAARAAHATLKRCAFLIGENPPAKFVVK